MQTHNQRDTVICHLPVRLKSKRVNVPKRINTVTFYLRDILMPLVGVVFKHIEQIQELLIYKC